MAYFRCKTSPAPTHNYLYYWDFTESLTDEIQGNVAEVKSNASRTSNGVEITGKGGRVALYFPTGDYLRGKTLEINVAKFDFKGNSSYGMNFTTKPNGNTDYATGPLQYNASSDRWIFYNGSSSLIQYYNLYGRNALDGKNVKLVFTDNDTTLYVDDVNYGSVNYVISTFGLWMTIGARGASSTTNSDQSYDCTISSVGVYANE